MGERLRERATYRPADRDGSWLYPGEAAHVLGLHSVVSYRQLQNLWFIARFNRSVIPWPPTGAPWPTLSQHVEPSEDRRSRWTKFEPADLLGARLAVRALGGSETFASERKPQLRRLRDACRRLHDLGFVRPLEQVTIRVTDGSFVADIEGTPVDLDTMQEIIQEVAERASTYLAVPLHTVTTQLVPPAETDASGDPQSFQLALNL
jgi:hypothetical protein